MHCRDATIKDSDQIVDIHIQSFKNFFLTTLGRQFLITFYKSFIKSNEAVTVVSYDESGDLTGFAMGSVRAAGFYKRLLLTNIMCFSIETARLLFKNPGAIIRLTRNLTKSGEKETNRDYSELLSISTLPEFKGQGVGNQLLEAFESRVKEKSGYFISLTTDYYNNEDVVRFYTRCGYKVAEDFITYPDRRMYRMIKAL